MGRKLTPEHREKISAALRARHLQIVKRPALAEPTQKRCSRCKELKLLSEFYLQKKHIKSGLTTNRPRGECKECTKAEKRQTYAKQKEADAEALKARKRRSYEREDRIRRRERDRENAARRRREEGRPVRGSRIVKQGNRSGERLDPKPLLALLEKELPRLAESRNAVNGQGEGPHRSDGSGALAEISGVPARNLYDLLHGKVTFIWLSMADRILSGLGLPHMLAILYPEES